MNEEKIKEIMALFDYAVESYLMESYYIDRVLWDDAQKEKDDGDRARSEIESKLRELLAAGEGKAEA